MNACYRWSFTFNKPDAANMDDEAFSGMFPAIEDCLKEKFPMCNYVFQLERGGQSGRLHYQGHLKLREKKRRQLIVRAVNDVMPGIHLTPDSRSGTSGAVFYCLKKDETYVAGPWTDPDFVPPEEPYDGSDLIKREEFRPWQSSVVEMLEGAIHPDHIYWVTDDAGGAGKSAFCKWAAFHKKWPKIRCGKMSDIMNLVFRLPAQKCYLVDITRTLGTDQGMDDIYAALEELKSGHICNYKYETGVKLMARPHVVVFSNKTPDLNKLSAYKWRFFKIENNELVELNRQDVEMEQIV
jgi:hypothetical protein